MSSTYNSQEGSRSNIIRESLRQLVLRVLAERPYHGYEIMNRIEEITNGVWRPAPGTLYPLLDQLKREGLIRVERMDRKGVKGGRRIVYALTEDGWRRLADIMFEKARKVDYLIYYIIEGCRILRENGFEGEAARVCAEARKAVEKFEEALEQSCSPAEVKVEAGSSQAAGPPP
ncbi:putative transcriptional regulator, PadR family [Aeropyrum pernix K1]|uniref:Transcriptional regulator, PadR family n=1 Tax=Aeropyrum pernix (strain ATCC 700893 / DSM 11879 / JCM 9820 / NBRC 100138 / K1) TaxID=272557 RepID=Q9YC94_AERPE|nr:PadR family transcriptional regulator [Aeropyrum pernix]BAA80354.2 putative transcriptional regulator, PadR family [Aeropyrum pernix K1]